MYDTISKAKFTLNGYGDFNQEFKSNMRLFESLGCGSLLLSEEGNYPEGFENGKNFISYKDSNDLLDKLPSVIENYETLKTYIKGVTEKTSGYAFLIKWVILMRNAILLVLFLFRIQFSTS